MNTSTAKYECVWLDNNTLYKVELYQEEITGVEGHVPCRVGKAVDVTSSVIT